MPGKTDDAHGIAHLCATYWKHIEGEILLGGPTQLPLQMRKCNRRKIEVTGLRDHFTLVKTSDVILK